VYIYEIYVYIILVRNLRVYTHNTMSRIYVYMYRILEWRLQAHRRPFSIIYAMASRILQPSVSQRDPGHSVVLNGQSHSNIVLENRKEASVEPSGRGGFPPSAKFLNQAPRTPPNKERVGGRLAGLACWAATSPVERSCSWGCPIRYSRKSTKIWWD
jgi:hypothetical protein